MTRFLFLAALGCALLAPGAATAETCLSATCHPKIGALKQLHQPVASGDCLSCHLRKLEAHPVKGGKSFELAAKGAELCAQCHKALGQMKVVHAPVKEGDCLSCHKVHGASGRHLLDVGDDQSALCLGCHDAAPFKEEHLHGPVAAGNCTSCHSPHESAEKWLLKKGERELCFKCHSDFATAMKKAAYVHPPVKSKPCTSCHNPHGSASLHSLKQGLPDLCIGCHAAIGKKLKQAKTLHKPIREGKLCGNCHTSHFSNQKGLLPSDEKGVCFGCHGKDDVGKPPLRNIAKDISGKKSLHGPIAKGGCGGCHDPHGSDFSKGLTGSYPDGVYAPYTETSYDLCLKCHNKSLLRFAETTMYTGFRNGKRNLHYLHVADRIKGHTCRSCHDSHGSDGAKLVNNDGVPFGEWKIKIGYEKTGTGGSCAPGCHRRLGYDRDKPADYTPVPRKPVVPKS